MAKQVSIKVNDIPDDWSQDAADLINKVNIFSYLVIAKKTGE